MMFRRRRSVYRVPPQAEQPAALVPHCDQRVLHAPGECEHCDTFPELQSVRQLWGIAFTGHQPGPGQICCPSDFLRGLNGADVWPGNRREAR